MSRLQTFLSILCVLLASVVGLILSLIHPGWAVRLTRHVSQSMVGGRRRTPPGGSRGTRRDGRGSPASKVSHESTHCRVPLEGRADGGSHVRRSGERSVDIRGGKGNLSAVYSHNKRRDWQAIPQAPDKADPKEVQSALVNLGMPRQRARQLSVRAARGRDFDTALRWAIARRAA